VCTFLFFNWNLPFSLHASIVWQRFSPRDNDEQICMECYHPRPAVTVCPLFQYNISRASMHRHWPQLLKQSSTQPDDAPELNNSRVEFGPPEGKA
jgi:hypothetical protein